MKNVTFTIEVTAKVPNHVNIDDVTFQIPLDQITPQFDGKPVGKVTGYTTTNAMEDEA